MYANGSHEKNAMNILFVCTSNIHRSKTAEDYCNKVEGKHVYKSAGLNEVNCQRHRSQPCSEELLEWADKVFVMEQHHIERIVQHTGYKFIAKITNLDIEDRYSYMDAELVKILLEKLSTEL